jgi:hypothetical protein
VVKVNLTVRVPAEVRQFIEELCRRYGLSMGELIAFVFSEFKSEIVRRLEERVAGARGGSSPGERGAPQGEVLRILVDMEARPVSEEDYYLSLASGW